MKRPPKIGAYVLETLTTGMYTEPVDTIREFIQNAADSIRKAEDAKVLKKREGRIQVDIDRKYRCVTIRDNGLGISSSKVADRLLNIGMSDKSIESDAGFRGIGRLAGIAYCNRLRFRTTANGEDETKTVEMDCVGIRKAISPAMRRNEELANVIARHSYESADKGRRGDHYFEVILDGITESGEVFLNWERLEHYLSQVAPVDYDPQDFIYAPTINSWVAERGLSVPTVTLVLVGPDVKREVFKPYRSHYKTAGQRSQQFDVHIKDIVFYPEDVSSDARFWLWYGKTDLLGTIGDERASGFRFRKNNIALGGPQRVAELFAETAPTNRRFNRWYVGEIHVLAPEAIPNARRDGFEPTGVWPEIRRTLMPFIRARCVEVQALSGARHTPLQKLLRSAEATIAKTTDRIAEGIVSPTEKENLLEKVHKEKKKASSWLEIQSKPKEAKKVKPAVAKLHEVEKQLERVKSFGVKRVRSTLDRKQRKLLHEVLGIVHDAFGKMSCPRKDACHEALREALLNKYQTKKKK